MLIVHQTQKHLFENQNVVVVVFAVVVIVDAI